MGEATDAVREPLNKRRILRAAVEFADAQGVEQLTMRKVAAELGFGVMSLYNHVANKDEMLTGMVELVASEIGSPPSPEGWRPAIMATSQAAHQALLRHPWAATQWQVRLPGPARIEFMDSILRVLTEARLSPELVYHGYHAVTMHIVGFTQQELSYKAGLGTDLEGVANAFLSDLPSGKFPHLVEHVKAHLSDDDHGDEFVVVLDLILDGIEAARA